MTRNEIYARYASKKEEIRRRLNENGNEMTAEEKQRYLAKEDLLNDILYDLAHMDE